MRARDAARPTAIAPILLGAALALVGCVRAPARPQAARPTRSDALAAADALRGSGELERAAAGYEAAVRADPSSVRAHLRWVAALSALGMRSRAREAYAARAAAPGASEADRVMAARLSGDGSDERLREVYAEATRRSPGNPWWRLGRAEVELGAAGAALAAAGEADASGDRARGDERRADARKALAAAEGELGAADRLGPSLAETALYRGFSALLAADLAKGGDARTREEERAEREFLRAVAADARLVEGWAGLAEARSRRGKEGEALLAWISAVRLSPSDPALRLGIGRALRSLDRPYEAAQQYRAAAVLRPRDAAPVLLEGDALGAAACYQRALEAYREALRRDPTAVEAHRRSGEVLAHLGRTSEARAAYQAYLDGGGADEEGVLRRIERLAEARR